MAIWSFGGSRAIRTRVGLIAGSLRKASLIPSSKGMTSAEADGMLRKRPYGCRNGLIQRQRPIRFQSNEQCRGTLVAVQSSEFLTSSTLNRTHFTLSVCFYLTARTEREEHRARPRARNEGILQNLAINKLIEAGRCPNKRN